MQLQLLSGIVNPEAFALLAGHVVSGDYTIEAVLDALEQRGVVTTLAHPTLVALSGETANFFAGGEFPIPVAVDDGGSQRRSPSSSSNSASRWRSRRRCWATRST